MYHFDSDPETLPEWSHTSDEEEDATTHSNPVFQEDRLNSESFRGDELVDDGYTSQISSSSPREETPPDTPDDAHLAVDRNSVAISNRSSLDLRLSFSPFQSTTSPAPPAQPSPPPLDLEPHLAFLREEIDSTWSSGEHFTHRRLVILWGYFACEDSDSDSVTREENAKQAAENLHRLNEEYLLAVSSWEILESDTQLQGFLWLVWTCLLEVVVRTDCTGDEMEGVVVLVGEMLAGGSGTNKKLEIKGKDGRTWTGSQMPTFSTIWESACLGFGPALSTSYPIEASPQDWIASHSFLGRLTAAGLADGWELEVWALDDALGETTWEGQGRLPTRTAECLVLAAAELIRHAGERLAAAAARLPRGWIRAFVRAKWEHWMERFGEVADLFEDGGPGPVQWAAWYAKEHMLVVSERAGLGDGAGSAGMELM
ncbi:hypothetical protein GE09DRAFT_1242106 [Coniochaeta sp. 2T2.1]|nr:hypothetical protein GE09DRAFT_1242106 [Coniochaeta sp. 2T2.1]